MWKTSKTSVGSRRGIQVYNVSVSQNCLQNKSRANYYVMRHGSNYILNPNAVLAPLMHITMNIFLYQDTSTNKSMVQCANSLCPQIIHIVSIHRWPLGPTYILHSTSFHPSMAVPSSFPKQSVLSFPLHKPPSSMSSGKKILQIISNPKYWNYFIYRINTCC
jgi:hypothetical protein